MRVVVRTVDGGVWVHHHATAVVDARGDVIVRGVDGRRLSVYHLGSATSFDLRPDDPADG